MKKITAILLVLICTPAVAQNYLRDDGIFHSVVEGTTTGQLLGNVSSDLGGITVASPLAITAGSLGCATCLTTTSSFANPTASVGLTIVNGSATTAMRSDAAPALSQAITPTMTGDWTFTSNVFAPNIFGGTAAGANLIVATSTSASPSGSLSLFGPTVTIGNGQNAATTINLNGASGGGVTVNIGAAGNGLNALNVYTLGGSKQTWVSGGGNTTITFPTATDTLVGKATTDTMTNKTLTSPTISNPAITGTATITPTAASLAQGLTINQSGPTSGTSAGPWSGNLITSSFGATVTGSSDPFFDNGAWQTWIAAHRVNFTVGANVAGEPVGAGFYQLIANTNAVGASDGDFIGLAGEAWANATITNGGFSGVVGAAIIGATSNVRVINGLFAEADILTGGVAVSRRGINIVSQGNITATGASDTAINVATSTTAAGFKNLIIIDTIGGTVNPIQSTGSILKSDAAFTVANVFNLPSATVTSSIMNFANFTVSGSGVLKAGAGTADSATGAMIHAAVTSGGVAALISQADGAANFNGFHTNNSTVVAGLYAVVNEPSSTTSIFGQSNGNWAEIVSNGASSNGMLFGTLTSDPIIFGINSTKAGHWNATGLGLGTQTPDAPLMVNVNTGASDAPASGTLLHLVGADATLTRITIHAYGSNTGVPVIGTYVSGGTLASKTALGANANILAFGGNAWDGSAYNTATEIDFLTINAQTSTDHSGRIRFQTRSTTASAALAVAGYVHGSGGTSWGADVDPGAGGLYLAGATVTLNALATDATHTDRTVCQDTTSKSLFFGSGALGICLGTSGAQFKTAFVPMQAGMDELAQISMLNYRYREGHGDGGKRMQYGPTAQDVERVLPDLVGHDESGTAINYDSGALLFIGLHSIQQLNERISKLENRK